MTPASLPSAPDSVGRRLRALALAEIDGAVAQLERDGSGRHEGIHHARKHLRRARAALALGGKRLGRYREGIDDELGRCCRGLSSLRDSQAMLEGIDRLLPAAPAELSAQAGEVKRLALVRREASLAKALARDPGFERRRARLQALAGRAGRLDWDAVDDTSLAKALARSVRRVHRARRKAGKRPQDDDGWHTLRRRLRRLRQQDTLLAAVQPALRSGEVAPAEETTRLGEAQDDALLLRTCGRRSPFPPKMRGLLRAEAARRLHGVRAGMTG